jgi:predicted nucleic acid-binding protein
VYLDTDAVLALVKPEDWLKEAVEAKTRGRRPLRTSVGTVLEAQFVLEREEQRELALAVGSSLRRRRVELLPVTAEVMSEADLLRRRVPVLHVFDGLHLATAKLAGETILSSDALFPLLRYVPVEPLP